MSMWLLGCGNMGGAMLRRWLAAGSAGDVTVIDPAVATVPAGVRLLRKVPDGEHPAIVVLAVKPQQLGDAAAALRGVRIGQLVSILAGVEIATLRARFDAGAVVRAMPNLPVAIGQGVVALYGDRPDDAIVGLMAPLGLVETIADEAQFNAVTALSGCGPGFVFRFIAALADAGVALGLPAAQAARLASATVAGAAAMARAADVSPAALADRVASPGGSTREGLNVLDADDALRSLLQATLAASARRNAELAHAGD